MRAGGFMKGGGLRDVQPDGESVSLKLAMREFEPEITYTLTVSIAVAGRPG